MADSPQYLVILPFLPAQPSYNSVKAVCSNLLLQVLTQLKQAEPKRRSILDVAVPCPHLWEESDGNWPFPPKLTRAQLYAPTQTIVANVYKLIAVLAALHDFEVADLGNAGALIDVRVLLLAHPAPVPAESGNDGTCTGASSRDVTNCPDVVVKLERLAKCGRPWKTLFCSANDAALANLFQKLTRSEQSYPLSPIHAEAEPIQPEAEALHDQKANVDKDFDHHVDYKSFAVGGTFDHLHLGHKLLLTMTLFLLHTPRPIDLIGEFEYKKHLGVVTIGVTGDALLQNKKYASLLQPWDQRVQTAHNFVKGICHFATDSPLGPDLTKKHYFAAKSGGGGGGSNDQQPQPQPQPMQKTWRREWSSNAALEVRYAELQDPYGPTATDPEIVALVVSHETRGGGEAVLKKRSECCLRPLTVFEVCLLDVEGQLGALAGDEEQAAALKLQAKISSSDIRKALSEKAVKREEQP